MKAVIALCGSLLLSFFLAACSLFPTDGPPPVSRTFWVDNCNDQPAAGWAQATAVLGYYNQRVAVYIRAEDQHRLSAARLQEYGDFFRDVAWPAVSKEVYELQWFFDEPGNRINIFFYDIDDRLGYAGYFWSKDLQSDFFSRLIGLRSNQTNIFYMDTDSAQDLDFTKGTLIHEFQHMATAHYFRSDPQGRHQPRLEAWLDEFASTAMESIHAGQYRVYVASYLNDFHRDFAQGRSSFLHWGEGGGQGNSQYAAAALLSASIWARLSDTARDEMLKTLLANSGTGDSSLQDLLISLQDLGYPGMAGIGSDEASLASWSTVMGNLLADLALPANTAFLSWINTCSQSSISTWTPPLMAGGTQSVNLYSGAFVLGLTAQGIVGVWNGSLPVDRYGSLGLALGSASFVTTPILAPPPPSLVETPPGMRSANPSAASLARLEDAGSRAYSSARIIAGTGNRGDSDGAGGTLYGSLIP